MPTINTDDCLSCGQCAEVCANEAIDVVPDKKGATRYRGYTIIQDRCIGCGECLKVDCPGNAIQE